MLAEFFEIVSQTGSYRTAAKTYRSKLVVSGRHLRDDLGIPLPLSLTGSDEVIDDDAIYATPVLTSANSQVRDDVYLGSLIDPWTVAQRTTLHVDYAFKSFV